MGSDDRDQPPPTSRPTRGALRARFEDKQDKILDDAMGRGETWAKNVRNNNRGVMLDEIPKLLGILGLKIVDASRTCITPQELAHYKACEVIAAGHLNPQPTLEQDFDPE